MALSPNVVVVNPGDLIASAHLNNIRANLDRIDISAAAKVPLAGGRMTGPLWVGDYPTTVGTQQTVAGQYLSRVSDGAAASVLLDRTGAGAAAAQIFATFARIGVPVGSITMGANLTSVAYNTTSDERLKHVDGDIVDAADRVRSLGGRAFRGRWLHPDTGEPHGETCDLLYAHDVDDVAPYAVTGERGAVDADGNIVPQQVDYPSLVPLLVAALAAAFDRIDALEAAA